MRQNFSTQRLRIGQITVEARQGRNTKILLFRNDRSDLPHLLISFGNLSKEIDIHLKSRTIGGQEELHEIAKVPEASVTTVITNIEPRFREVALQHIVNTRPVRPGWLGKKGYMVSHVDEESERKLVEMFAPKRKYHSKWERVLKAAGLDDFIQSDLPGQMLFLPSVLNELSRLRYSRAVMVHRIRGRHKPAITAVRPGLDANGRLKWFPMHKMIDDLKFATELVAEQLKALVSEDKLKLLWDELHLEEVDWIARSASRN